MNGTMKKQWLEQIGSPKAYDFEPEITFLKGFEEETFYGELYKQANGPGTFQRVMILFPKHIKNTSLERGLCSVPGVVVPFYFPEAMLGYNPFDSTDDLSKYKGIEMMLHLVLRGYAVISADSYHLTYLQNSERTRDDTWRWREVGAALNKKYPEWSGIGKLVFDTKLLVDFLMQDPRVQQECIGIAGHSLGGKMAFYTGCLDERIKAILASDFGICWEQTNWSDTWYWGDKVQKLKAMGMDHSGLLEAAAPKPFFLIAGQYDDETSYLKMLEAKGYDAFGDHLGICNHGLGHRPPAWALGKGYAFLDKWLKDGNAEYKAKNRNI